MSTTEHETVDESGVRNRIRVNVTKNTKGYVFDRTVEVEWEGDPNAGIERARNLLAITGRLAREDIDNNQRTDEVRGEVA